MSLSVVTLAAGPEYEEAAARLKARAARHGVDVFIDVRPDRGVWRLNTAWKPHVIAAALAAAPGPVLFLDADCDVRGRLNRMPLFIETYEVAVRHQSPPADPHNSGVILMRNTPTVVEFVRRWAVLADAGAEACPTGDQPFMTAAAAGLLQFGRLSQAYNAPPGVTAGMILHSRMSRRLRPEPPIQSEVRVEV